MRPRQTKTKRTDSGLSAASLSAVDGDDLARARQFCQSAGGEMAVIIAADRTAHPYRTKSTAKGYAPKKHVAQGRDPVWLCERLSLIQRSAKRARARAVYRSAQDVLALIQLRNAHMPIDWTRVDGRLFVLNKLMGQYEAGLGEVEIQTGASSRETQTPNIPPEDTDSFDPVHAMACETLSCLLPHASEAEQAALKRLVDYRPQIEEVAAEPAPVTTDTLEHVLPDLVQQLLEVGRQYGKILSVSHALDDVRVKDGTASDVAALLFERLSELVAGSLPLQGVGRLDISASTAGLRISGSGFDSFELPLETKDICAEPDPTETSAFEPGIAEQALLEPNPAPRINENTEDDLRAQLAALMDGGVTGS